MRLALGLLCLLLFSSFECKKREQRKYVKRGDPGCGGDGTCEGVSKMMSEDLWKLTTPKRKATGTLKDKYKEFLSTQYPDRQFVAPINSLLEIFDQMISKENTFCSSHLPVYFGAGFAGALLAELRGCMPKSTFSPMSVAEKEAELRAKCANECSKEEQIKFDRNGFVARHLQSVSLNLASTGRSESVIDFWMTSRNLGINAQSLKNIISSIWSEDPEKAAKLSGLVDTYADKIHRAIVQVLIKKEDVNNLMYISAPFGRPIKVNALTFLEQLGLGMDKFNKWATANGRAVARLLGGFTCADCEFGKKNWYGVVQGRILVSHEDYINPEKVVRTSFYTPEENEAAIQMQHDIAEICGA